MSDEKRKDVHYQDEYIEFLRQQAEWIRQEEARLAQKKAWLQSNSNLNTVSDQKVRVELSRPIDLTKALSGRPPRPTAAYCLQRGFGVRWDEEMQLPPLDWRLLEYLLQHHDGPVSLEQLEDVVWQGTERASKTVYNAICRLNASLEAIKFPWKWHVRSAHVHREG